MEVLAVCTNNTEDELARIKVFFGQDGIILESETPEAISQLINNNQADILITDGRYLNTALIAKIPFLDINIERNHAYAGYRVILEMTRELYATFYNPVWEQVSQPASWDVEKLGEEITPSSPTSLEEI